MSERDQIIIFLLSACDQKNQTIDVLNKRIKELEDRLNPVNNATN